jgi:UDP-N-acetylglucosamine/UDP-N-acetylgalactosamine diphosphorylase
LILEKISFFLNNPYNCVIQDKNMNDENNYEYLKKLLESHRQSHLLKFYDRLDTNQQAKLFEQISQLDFDKIDKWIADYVKKTSSTRIYDEIFPVWAYEHQAIDPHKKQRYLQAAELGQKLIREGKVAAFLVAGGQGTRLNFDGPKGNFPISPVKNKTLFRIFAETIAAVCTKYNTVCPWYIMTSPLNYDQTVDIFESNGYFGLAKNNVFIFQQGTIPNFDTRGRILLNEMASIACSPDGHGGSINALAQSGALDDMKNRGVEILSYWQVDNPLINIFDSLFIGLHTLHKSEMSSKAVIKTIPDERVGNFCLSDGRVTVIEYTELPEKLANQRNPDGSLVFQLASIGIHLINRSFIEKFSSDGLSLPLHKAIKSIQHIDEKGKIVKSDGIKLESFIFDALPLAQNSIILQTLRNEEFAPTKNATGIDSVESTRKMMIARAADWLSRAGVNVPRKKGGTPDCIIEIAPSFALQKEDINAKINQIPQIAPGDSLYLD